MENFFNEELSDRDMVKQFVKCIFLQIVYRTILCFQITQWFNELITAPANSEKIETFHKIQEYLIRKATDLLPDFLQDILNLTTSKSGDIKKALIGCIEEIWYLFLFTLTD